MPATAVRSGGHLTMRSGKLRHRVQLQKPVHTIGDEGSIDRAWETVGSRWAQVQPLRGREFWSAAEVNSDVTHRVRMRYDPEITSNHRLLFGQYESGRVLNIDSVLDVDERTREMDLLCVEVKS